MEYLCLDKDIYSLIISLVALVISIVALYYTVRAFILKIGHKFRCSTSVSSSIDCEQSYVSSIIIENQKDKAAIIFKIYLQIGRGNYLVIEDFSENPLIINPFEVYYKKYEPILFYSDGTNVTSLNNVLNNRKIPNKVILATTKGKYKVKNNIQTWDALSPYFNNHLTRLLSPIRLNYKNNYYGSEIKYIVTLTLEDQTEQIIKIYCNNKNNSGYKNSKIQEKHISSKLTMQDFFNEQRIKGNIKFESVEVFDFGQYVDKMKKDYNGKTEPVKSHSFFKYFIVGKVYTIIDNIELWKMNKNIKLNNKKK